MRKASFASLHRGARLSLAQHPFFSMLVLLHATRLFHTIHIRSCACSFLAFLCSFRTECGNVFLHSLMHTQLWEALHTRGTHGRALLCVCVCVSRTVFMECSSVWSISASQREHWAEAVCEPHPSCMREHPEAALPACVLSTNHIMFGKEISS